MTKVTSYRSPDNTRAVLPGRGVSTLADFLLRPIFLMTRTKHYDPNPALRLQTMGTLDNNKTATSNYENFSPEKAAMQHSRLRALKNDLGASIILDDGQPGHFDGVYAADPTITLMRLTIKKGEITNVHFDTIASMFYNHSRSGEVARQVGSITFLKRYLAENFGITATSTVHMPKVHGEGTGDNIYDPYRDMFFSGYKPKTGEFKPTEGRSDPEFHRDVLWGKMHVPTFGFEVHNGCFHADTVTGPLEDGDVVVYPGGLSAEDGLKVKMMAEAPQKKLIIVSEEDARLYAPNLTDVMDRNVITAVTTQKFRRDLEAANYHNHQTELDQFVQQSGGGAHCLGNRIILRRDDRAEAMRLLDYTP